MPGLFIARRSARPEVAVIERSNGGAAMWPLILGVMVFSLPGIALRFGGLGFGVRADTAIYGLSIVAAAFLLAWAAEAAEMDISQGLAVAAVALIAVLPEY